MAYPIIDPNAKTEELLETLTIAVQKNTQQLTEMEQEVWAAIKTLQDAVEIGLD